MQAEDNPLIMLKKSKHKSIEDLQKQVRINQSQLQRIWNLEKRRNSFGRKDSMKRRWAGVESTGTSVMLTANASQGIPYLHPPQKVD